MSAGDSGGVVYARFGRRLLATIVDSVFFGATSAAVLYLLYGPNYFSWVREPHDMFELYGTADALVQYLLPLVVTVAMWRLFGATPGKFLAGCQVVDANTLQRLSLGRALVRYLGYFVSMLPLGAGFLWVLIDKRRQGFHDKLAKTVVIIEDETRKSLKQLEREVS